MTAIDSNASVSDAIDIVRRSGYSHVPVYEGKRSNITGMVSLTVWDLVEPGLADVSMSDLIKGAYFVPVQQPVANLLPVLRSRQDQSAIVVDEFGSAVGLISVDKILESIVGNIEAGTTFENRKTMVRPGYEVLDDDLYLMDARLPIADVNDLLATTITTTAAHTIGGLIVARLRHVPRMGESINEEGYEFAVEEATDRAVTRVRVARIH
jgi:CBS domain containing-hemolysin-like protein